MSGRKRILVSSILVMAGGMFCTAAVILAILYRLGFEEQRNHLVEIARGQAHFMEAVARFDATHNQGDHPGGARAATLSQITAAHEYYSGFGETGELVVAQQEGDQIVYLFPYRHGDESAPDPIPWASDLAEPMRLALLGQEGALIGLDYRGESVLAAYHPVAVLNLGVVAKADLAEIRAPFVLASAVAGGVTVLLVFVGAGLTLWITRRLVRQLWESQERLRLAVEQSPASIVITDTRGTIEYVNPMFTEVTGYTAEEAIGQNPRILQSGKWPKKAYKALWDKILAGEVWRGEFENKKKSGELYWEAASICPIRDAEGTITHFLAIKQDITERKMMETQLRERERRTRVIVESAHDAFIAMDADGMITDWNAKAEKIFGWSRQDAVGRRLSETIIPPQYREQHNQGLKRFLAVGAGAVVNKAIELAAVNCDGHEFPVELAVTPIRLGDSYTFTAFVSDITERKTAERALQEAHDKLEQRVEERTRALQKACQAKSEFLATMSHELRTPLNGVIGMTDLLLGTDLDTQQRKQAALAKASGKLLLNLINDILDFSKIEAGKLELEHDEFDLPGSLDTVISTMAQAAQNKNLELQCHIQPGVPQAVLGDELRLQQILLNLLSNAIKFTESGEVIVRARIDTESQTHSTVKFSVSDTGVGIPRGRVNRIFDVFSQADSSTTRKYGGSGLGLAICKQLTKLMGGQIGVESEPGKGSTFWFTAEVEKGSVNGSPSPHAIEAPTAPEKQQVCALQTTSARILVAEDNEIGQEVAVMTLTQAGYTCDIASDGQQAVEAVRRDEYDLVLMDCQMPEMDGFEATRQIRQREAEFGTARIPILALTANALKGDRERCLESGMDDYTTKPLDPERLIHMIESLLHPEDNSMVDPQAQPNESDESANHEPPLAPAAFDYDGLLKRWGGKKDFVEMLITKFRHHAPTVVDKLEQSIAAGDAEETMRVAHGLKGTAGYVAAESIRQLAARLEERARAGDLSDAEAYLSQLRTAVCRCIDDSRTPRRIQLRTQTRDAGEEA